VSLFERRFAGGKTFFCKKVFPPAPPFQKTPYFADAAICFSSFRAARGPGRTYEAAP
jgi:hypothetical protein